MTNIQAIADKVAVSLSLLCTIHCLAMPLAVVFLPILAALPLADEAFHLWMVYGVLPISIYALAMGCKKHKRYRLLLIGGLGLTILVGTALVGHEVLGEVLEKSFTVLGASIIALGHYWNFRLCQRQDNCGCPDHTE